MTRARVLVVEKRTQMQRFLEGDPDRRTAELLDRRDPVVAKWRQGHQAHQQARRAVREALKKLGARVTTRSLGDALPATEEFALVVTVGGDGTLLAASHSVGDRVPLLGVNSAPGLSVGFFCATHAKGALDDLADALAGRMRAAELTRMRVLRQGDQELSRRVLNEVLFCHDSPAATSRYLLGTSHDDGCGSRRFLMEEQRSSGLWIGPAAGSTAAQRSAGGRILPITSTSLQFVVREPYVPLGERLQLRKGLVLEHEVLEIRSKMRRAKLFVDGEDKVFSVGLGDVLSLSRSPESLVVLGISGKRRPWAKPAPA